MTIYLTSIIQKAQNTYRRFSKARMWRSVVIWVVETGEPGGNHRPRLNRKLKILIDDSRRRGCWRSVAIRGGGNRRTRGKPPTSIIQKAQNTYRRFSKARMLAICGHAWWRKPENQGNTTDLGRANTTVPHADTGI